MKKNEVIVIGSGPAGLWAAYSAYKHGSRVKVLEARGTLSSKLLISGAGKCNFTNVLSGEEQAEKFGRNWRFMLPAYQEFSPQDHIDELKNLGVDAVCEDGFHYFPASQRASDIVKALRLGDIEFINNTAAVEVLVEEDHCVGVLCQNNRKFMADAIILATGGISYAQLGDVSKVIYKIAEQIGHKITPLYPALAGVQLVETKFADLTALVLDNAELSIKLGKTIKSTGTLLFTHHGFSGPAILDHSAAIAQQLARGKQVELQLSWFAERSAEFWQNFFNESRVKFGTQLLTTALGRELTAKSAKLLARLANIPEDCICAKVPAQGVRELVDLLTRCKLTIKSIEPWHKAMATSGGVSRKEVESTTLESKLLKGVLFAGEVLELAGPCGGYNIQWAASSGYLAGKSAAQI